MRVLRRNKQKAYYQLLDSITNQLDRNGVWNGNFDYHYGEKTAFKANIHMGSESAFYEPYGTQTDYGITMYMSEVPEGWNEQTVLWIGETDKANYIVTSISRNLNGMLVRARELK